MVEPVERDTRGILRPAAGLDRFRLVRFAPSATAARFVDRYWIASWSLPGGEDYEQQVLVHPVINVIFDHRGATTGGIPRGRFSRVLSGEGRVLGVMFRPGGFRPFLGRPLSTLTETTVPLADVAPDLACSQALLMGGLADGAVDEELVTIADEAISRLAPLERAPCEQTTAWAELAAANRTIHRVDELAAIAGVSVRHLQRCFADHVGVSPKWVIRRYRLYEVAERAAREALDWATLAAELGYADQAHLVRDFTAAVGEPPARYTRHAGALLG